MKQMKSPQHVLGHAVAPLGQRTTARVPTTFGLMYSALDKTEVLIGDGMVVDLSRGGLGIRGNRPVRAGLEVTLFLYLPDGEDPLFVLAARVAWSKGRHFGVQFTRLSQCEGKRLQAFLLAQGRL